MQEKTLSFEGKISDLETQKKKLQQRLENDLNEQQTSQNELATEVKQLNSEKVLLEERNEIITKRMEKQKDELDEAQAKVKS